MHGHHIITGEVVSSSRGQLQSSNNNIVSRPHRVHSLCIVLEQYVTQGAGERDSKIASSELSINNGHIAKYLKATSLLDQLVNWLVINWRKMNNKLTTNYQLNGANHLVQAQFVEIIFKRGKIALYHISSKRTKNLLCLLCDWGVQASKRTPFALTRLAHHT